MKIKLLTVLVMSAVLSLAPLSSFAHHGSAAYDMTKLVTAKATVTSLLWANPHTMLSFDIKDANGSVTHWALEMFNPLWMTRAGWNRNILKTGDEIMALFDELHAKGNTIILVTHEPDIAEYAHRVVHIRDGIIASDSVSSGVRRPKV